MIDFELSEEHKAVEQTVREWAAKTVAPKIHDLDREHRFERSFLKGMAELQLLGICIPEEYGGAGMDYLSLGLACEELEYVDTHLRVILSVHLGLNSMSLWCWGTEGQKKKYLVPQAKGEKISTYGLTEPNAGSDAVASGATGLIRACLDASVKYAQGRHTFGKPIGEHQLVKEMIAEMVSDYDAARLLWMRAGWLKNQGLRNTRETSLAKWFATVKSERAASDCVQIHGGNGYSDEYPVGRFYRNCKAAVIYEGTREIHKLMQADYALGYRQDRPRRVELPPYNR